MKDRAPDVVKEYNRLRQKSRRTTVSTEAANITREKQKARSRKTREDQIMKDKENEKKKLRKQKKRENN